MKKCKRMLSLLCAIVLIVTLVAPTAMALQGPDVSVPDDYDLLYFVDCGASAFPANIQTMLAEHTDTVKNADTPDQAYNGTWGYTNAPAEMEANNSSSQDIYESVRNFVESANGKTLQYKFAADAGQYKVYVGLYDPWAYWNKVRQGSVSVSSGAAQTHTYSNGAKLMSFDVTVAGGEGLTMDIAPVGDTVDKDHDVLVSFIMVSKKVEQPQPELPELPVPGTNYLPFVGDAWVDVTTTCTNDNAAHEITKTTSKNRITAQILKAADNLQQGEDGTWTCQVTLDAGAMLESVFQVPHTGEDVTTTAVYNETRSRWELPAEPLTFTGVCDQNGPEGPAAGNIADFYISVYSHEPQLDGTEDYDDITYFRWDVANRRVNISYSQPVKNEEGVWTSTATVNAEALLEEVCQEHPDENYHWEDTEPGTKNFTVTYNPSSKRWSAGDDGFGRKGVAFVLEKYYAVTLAPGRDLTQIPAHGEEIVLGAYKTGTPVELPDTTTFTADNGVFAGWRVSIKRTPASAPEVFFFPAGTDMAEMFAHDVTLEAYWMDVVLDVATKPYDSSLGVDDYTFGDSANFTMEGDTITLLYRAQVQGNSEYPYVLTCDGAEAVYNSELNGAIDKYDASEYVYFTVTYTAEEAAALTEETVTMGNASDSVAVTVEADSPAPEGPRKGNCEDFYVTVYGKEPRTDYMYYSVRSSYRWDTMPSKYQVNITFSEVTQNAEGQWVCTATVDAAAYVEAIAQASASANFFPMDEPTTKTVELTYNESTGKWVAAPDGITYGYPSKPETRNGVAFGLEKRYTVSFAPGRDLSFGEPTGEAPESMVCAPGETVELPETCQFVTEHGIFAGWTVTIKKYVNDPNPKVYFYPIGTDMTMFNQDVELKAYWMDVELEAATTVYDDSLSVKDYTFAPEVYLTPEGDSVTVLYRANVLGNSQYPYILTCDGAEAVYNSELSGAIDYGKTSKYVYFTVTYTAEEFEALTEETVTMGNASGSVPVVHAPDLPVPGQTVLYFADGEWVSVTYTCTNENAVHTPANTKSGKQLSFNKQYLKAAGGLERNENGQFTCQVTLDTAALLSGTSGFKMEHTGDDVVLTAVYNETKGRWELPAEPVEIVGTCTQHGPEAPNNSNCTDFYVTVYGYEPQVSDSVRNSTLRSTIWYIARNNNDVTITFSEPQKNDEGVWTCQATIEAEDWVQKIYESFTSSHYRRDNTDPTTKTITLTYNQGKGKWVAESDGIDYGTPTKPETRNGVAFRLVKQYTVTYAPGRDLAGRIPSGEKVDGGVYDKGAEVQLPQTTTFVTENGVFAGWIARVKDGTETTLYYYPLGTETMTMFGKDVELEAMWMDVELEVADLPYDENKSVGDYTFGDAANFVIDGDTVTVLYRANVRGNSQYPYALTVPGPGATAVYGSELTGTIDRYQASEYVYFTVTYTAEEFEAMTQQTVTMGNASDSVDVTVTVEHHAEAVAGVDPTCTEDGSKPYWHCTGCGKYFADEACTQEIQDIDTWKVIPATGHAYGEPVFQWSDDGKTCTVTFTCGNDATHVEVLKAEVSSTVKTAPTCTEKGVTAYTAKVTFQGKDYTDTLELTDIPATGHHFEDGVCTECGEKDPDYVEPTKPATDPEGPDQTGENTPVALLMSLVLISAACLAVVIAKSRKVHF